MRKILLIIVVLLLLAGAGVAVWVYLTGRLHPGETAAPPEPAPANPNAPPVYADLRPFQLPVISGDRVEQMVSIKVTLQVPDFDARERVMASAPRLNDAYLQALYGTLPGRGLQRGNGAIDVAQLKQRILEISRRTMGEGVVVDALVQAVTQRRL